MKTRVHSPMLGDLISALGADDQGMAFAEVYTALERGILDAGVTAASAGYGQRWYEVIDYHHYQWRHLGRDTRGYSVDSSGGRTQARGAQLGNGVRLGRRIRGPEHRAGHNLRRVLTGSAPNPQGRCRQRSTAQVDRARRRPGLRNRPAVQPAGCADFGNSCQLGWDGDPAIDPNCG